MARTYRAVVRVMLLDELLDPQGDAVKRALHKQGFSEVEKVRIGKSIEIALRAQSKQKVRQLLERACRELLANPLVEKWEITEIEEVCNG